MRKKITTKEFIAICNKIHNFKNNKGYVKCGVKK